MKATRHEIASALMSLPSAVRGVLVFGPDEGLVRERMGLLAKQLVPDLSDPFRVVRLTPESVKSESARLADEMSAISMTGGRRLVLLEGAGDREAAAVEAALDRPSDALLIVLASDLARGSRLRKLFETAPSLLAIPCYGDDPAELAALIREDLGAAGLEATPEALSWLVAHLGSDRQVTRREIEKLILMKGEDEDRRIGLDEARLAVGDSAALTLGDLAAAVSGGEVRALPRLLDQAAIAGESPVAILRVVLARFQKMHLARGYMARGLDAGAAAARLSPPLFYKERDAFVRHLALWPQALIEQALARLVEAEAACKTTGLPAATIAERTCLALAAAVRRRD